MILALAASHIPKRNLSVQKSTHPWLNRDLVALVAAKRAAAGTPDYERAVLACSSGIMAEYSLYNARARQRLLDTKRGSKHWWNISRELLSQRANILSIPALKAESGEWRYDSVGKSGAPCFHLQRQKHPTRS